MGKQFLVFVLALASARFGVGVVAPGYTCTDIDECQTQQAICPAHSTCSNTIGSYTCVCDQGYAKVNGVCKPRDVCQVDNGGCGRKKCTNRNNRPSCSCSTYLLSEAVATIAVGKCVKMSSQQPCDFNRCYDGSHLVDTVKGGALYDNLAMTVSTQPPEVSPWVQVDLSENRCILGVKIYGTVGLGVRLNNVLVNMGERESDVRAQPGSAAECVHFKEEAANGQLLTCNRRMYSRYVRVISYMSYLPLTLKEVEVLGW